MTYLLDVNLLLACGWASHPRHTVARAWLERQTRFATCALSELGFLRVSMSPGYRACFPDAQVALADITSRRQAKCIDCDVRVATLPMLSHQSEVTDAYLIELARKHGLKLATLDGTLCQKAWAAGIAEDPL